MLQIRSRVSAFAPTPVTSRARLLERAFHFRHRQLCLVRQEAPGSEIKGSIMKPIFAAAVTAAFIVGLTPASAAGAHRGMLGSGHGMRSGHGIRGLSVDRPLRVPNMQSRIPAPLPAPAQAPVINGPLTPNPMLPPMGNGL